MGLSVIVVMVLAAIIFIAGIKVGKRRGLTQPRFRWVLRLGEFEVEGENKMLASMSDSQKMNVAINPLDKKGNPAKVDGIPVWSVADLTIVTLQVADDGMSAEIFAAGPEGTTQVTVAADADLGPGVTTITDSLDVVITGGAASTLGFTLGAPEEQ